jgi:hypothetical protein
MDKGELAVAEGPDNLTPPVGNEWIPPALKLLYGSAGMIHIETNEHDTLASACNEFGNLTVQAASQSICMPAAWATCFAVPILEPNFRPSNIASNESYEICRNFISISHPAASTTSNASRSQRGQGGSVPITVTSIVLPDFFIKGFDLN